MKTWLQRFCLRLKTQRALSAASSMGGLERGGTDLPPCARSLDDAVIAVRRFTLILLGWRRSINIWASWNVRIESQGKEKLRV